MATRSFLAASANRVIAASTWIELLLVKFDSTMITESRHSGGQVTISTELRHAAQDE